MKGNATGVHNYSLRTGLAISSVLNVSIAPSTSTIQSTPTERSIVSGSRNGREVTMQSSICVEVTRERHVTIARKDSHANPAIQAAKSNGATITRIWESLMPAYTTTAGEGR